VRKGGTSLTEAQKKKRERFWELANPGQSQTNAPAETAATRVIGGKTYRQLPNGDWETD
jgi:hypothetical protein